jgi:GTPase SAR1 family protein
MLETIEQLKGQIKHLTKFKSLFNKNKIVSEIDTILEKLANDTDLIELHQKQNLVAELLLAKSDNIGLHEFKNILNNEFMEFANKESSLSNEAEAILKLQAIEKELEIIVAYPDLYTKSTIAIGGGFSAGKSEFISSFLNSDIKLPIGIEPTTAIPVYVVNHDKKHLIGCNHKGGTINLADIDEDFQSKLSHKFIKSFGFNLKEIMPFMVLGSNIDYEHICFIDTPGYNPSDIEGSHTNLDIGTAKEFLSNSSSLIWLIGADSNGTIPASDLEFLSDLDLDNKQIYIILNKSDLRGESDIQGILDEIEESLDDYDIEVIGLSAYSSTNKKEYEYRKKSLIEFINSCNNKSKTHENLVRKIYDVYSLYKRAITSDINTKSKMHKVINSIELDFLEDDYENKKISLKLNEVKKEFNADNEKMDLKHLDGIFDKLKNSIDLIFNNELKINIKSNIDNDILKDFSTEKEELSKNKKGESENDTVFWIVVLSILIGFIYVGYYYFEYTFFTTLGVSAYFSMKNATKSLWKYSSMFLLFYSLTKLIGKIVMDFNI